jgi:hypothetical protein
MKYILEKIKNTYKLESLLESFKRKYLFLD